MTALDDLEVGYKDQLTVRLAASTRLVTSSSRESRCPHDTPTVDQCVLTCWLRKVKGTVCGRADDLSVRGITTDISMNKYHSTLTEVRARYPMPVALNQKTALVIDIH